MFLNLYYLRDPAFRNHNFSDFWNDGGGDPILRVSAEKIQTYITASYRPDPQRPGRLEGFPPDFNCILPMTLSDSCCASFIRTHPELPIAPRDYVLSKAYQFLHAMILIRYSRDAESSGDTWAWPEPFEIRHTLQQSLDQISVEQLKKLCTDDPDWWWDTYADTLRYDLEAVLKKLRTRFDRRFSPQSSAPSKRKREHATAKDADSLKGKTSVTVDRAAGPDGSG